MTQHSKINLTSIRVEEGYQNKPFEIYTNTNFHVMGFKTHQPNEPIFLVLENNKKMTLSSD